MTRAFHIVSKSKKRLTLLGALVVLAVSAVAAVAYFTSTGAGAGTASVGSLNAPTLNAPTPGAGTVALSWTTVSPPVGSDPVTYYVTHDGGDAGGNCPTAGATSCTDSGLGAGAYHYTVTAKWHSWTATSNTQTATVTSGALDHFAITPATGTQTAGAPFSVTVTAKDAANNTVTSYTGTIRFTSNDGQAVLPSDYAFVSGDSGTHTFTNGVTLKTAGSGKTVTVADGGTTGNGSYTVVHADASQITLTGSTSDLASGAARTYTATIKDTYGNTVDSGPDSGVSVSFVQTGGAGSVSGAGSVAASGGVATKSLTGSLAGSVTVGASATLSVGATSSNTLTFSVVHGAASQISLSGSTSDLTSGSTRTFTATIQDAAGNTVTDGPDSTDAISFSQTAGSGSVTFALPNSTLGGVATDVVTGATAGAVTIKASATLSGPGSTDSNTRTFNVVAGAANHIDLSGSTSDLASASTRLLTATIKDAAGNTVTSDSTTSIAFAKTTGAGTVSGLGSSIASSGVATKTVTGALTGSITLAASASSPSIPSGATLTFNVVAGAADHIDLSGSTADLASGSTRSLTATIKDAAGNTVTSDSTTSVAFAKTGGTGTVSSLGSSTASSGVATKTVTGALAGSITLAASSTSPSIPSGTTLAFNVVAGAAAKLAFTTSPSNSGAGVVFGTQPVVTVQDAGGNTVAGDSSNVTLAITSGTGTSGAALACTANPKAASSGVVTFAGCKIDKSGTGYTLTATDGSLTSAVSNSFDIAPGTATSLVLSAATTTPTAGAGDNLTITAKDSGGNTATGYTGDKTLTFSGANAAPDGTLPTVSNKTGTTVNFGTAMTITFTNGVATVSGANNGVMKLYKAETASIIVSDGSLNNGTGLAVTITPAARVGIILTSITQPAPAFTVTGAVGTTLTYTSSGESNATTTASAKVSLSDQYRNPVTNSTGTAITIDLAATGDGSVAPTGSSVLSIANGSAESGTSFTLSRNNGNGKSATLTATVHGTSQILKAVMSS